MSAQTNFRKTQQHFGNSGSTNFQKEFRHKNIGNSLNDRVEQFLDAGIPTEQDMISVKFMEEQNRMDFIKEL